MSSNFKTNTLERNHLTASLRYHQRELPIAEGSIRNVVKSKVPIVLPTLQGPLDISKFNLFY